MTSTRGGAEMAPHGSLSVALIVASTRAGGAERSTISLAQGLTRQGAEVDLVVLKERGPYEAEARAAVGDRLIHLDRRRLVGAVFALVRYLRRRRPSVVVAGPDDVAAVAAVAARLAGGVPLAAVVRSTISERDGRLGRLDRLKSAFSKAMLRRARFVVAVSDEVARDLESYVKVDPARIVTIPNGFDFEMLAEAGRAEVVHRWVNPDHRLIVALGRLSPPKDYPTLLHAFARVAKLRDNARLLIFGEGPERQALERMSGDLGLENRVEFRGFEENPWRYLARAEAYVLSSRWEGFPRALVEALACGVPAVATDCRSGPGEILQGGERGLLVPVGVPESLADAIMVAMDGRAPKADLSELEAEYGLDAVASSYVSSLRAALTRDGSI